ncbi:MAG: hypothetical protein M1824_001343 [Vezdaea acicularis]|nr:MAG: hypothetical protein M1824_001343 [Vezdaea acicularis]
MDPFSGVASVCGITSLAIQLGQGIKGLYDFWKEVQNAPEDVAQITQGLQIIQAVLLKIAQNAETERFQSQNESIVQDALKTLQSHIQRLEKLLEPFQTASSGGKIRQRWSAVKIVRDKDKIKKCKALINEAQMTLGNVQTLDLSEALFMARQEVASVESLSYATVQRTMSIESKVDVLLNDVQDQIKRQNSIEDNRALSNGLPVAALSKKLMQLALQGALASVDSDDDLRTALETYSAQGSRIPAPIHELSGSSVTYAKATSKDGPLSNGAETFTSHKYETMTRPQRTPLFKKTTVESHSGFYEAYIARIYYQTRLVHIEATEQDEDKDPYDKGNRNSRQEVEKRFMVFPKFPRFLSKMFSFSFTRSQTYGWLSGINISPQNFRDEDALIFEFCSKGNIDGIMTLFSRGEATPHDVDPDGWTPMHYAAQTRNPKLCKFLAIQGASGNALDLSNCNPIQMSMKQNPYKRVPPQFVKRTSLLETVRVLVEYGSADPSLENSGGQNTYDLMSSGTPEVISWLLRNTPFDFDPSHRETNGKPILIKLLIKSTTTVQDLDTLISLGADVNCRMYSLTEQDEADGLCKTWTALHFVAECVDGWYEADGKTLSEAPLDRARLLLQRGADLHAVCARGETPTDRLFCHISSDCFVKWIDMLKSEGINMVEFAKGEIEAHAGTDWYVKNECYKYLRDMLRLSYGEEDEIDEFLSTIPSIVHHERRVVAQLAAEGAKAAQEREQELADRERRKRSKEDENEEEAAFSDWWEDQINEEPLFTTEEEVLEEVRRYREERRTKLTDSTTSNGTIGQQWKDEASQGKASPSPKEIRQYQWPHEIRWQKWRALGGAHGTQWREWNRTHEEKDWVMYGTRN